LGGAKRMWEEAQERGFSVDENIIVCENCFEDYAIKEFIKNNDTGQLCNYCGTNKVGSCSLEIVLEHIMYCIHTEWGHPANEGLPYETREGGWQGAVYDSWEMFDSIGLDINSDKLQDDIMSSLMDNEWCERNPYSLSEDKTLFYGWRDFSRFVTTEARYVFLKATPSTYDEHQHDEMHPVQILEALSNITKKLDLIRPIKKETPIYRVRLIDISTTLSSAAELGPPPLQHANVPNRMSPAGIPMFYGAFDSQTAILETYDSSISSGKKAAVARFLPTRDLAVLDLSKPLFVPSIFDSDAHTIRPWIKFIIEFMRDFTKPISRDDRSHIEYVPTQVVTEYFRHIVRTDDDLKLDGIVYPSSKANGEPAVVLFANSAQCVDKATSYSGEAILFLDNVEEVHLPK
jgi:hypothetical protein